MKFSSDRFPLIDLPRKLREVYGMSVAYHTVWKAVVDGALPAERRGSRWYISVADLPTIAASFGHSVPSQPGSDALAQSV